MPIQILNTKDSQPPRLVMCVYGVGKTGKTTLATTAPKPIILDAENGVKGLRTAGINVPYVAIKNWEDIEACYRELKDSKEYETIVIDPLGNFMSFLLDNVKGSEGMTLPKWGQAIEKFKKFVFAWTQSGKHVIFVAHDTWTADDGSQLRTVQLPGKDLPSVFKNMMDVIGYYSVEANGDRVLLLQPTTKISAGTRFKCFPPTIKSPNITDMITSIHKSWETK